MMVITTSTFFFVVVAVRKFLGTLFGNLKRKKKKKEEVKKDARSARRLLKEGYSITRKLSCGFPFSSLFLKKSSESFSFFRQYYTAVYYF